MSSHKVYNIKYDNELNERMSERYFPSQILQPNFDPRPEQTKYTHYHITDQKEKTSVSLKTYPQFNPSKIFNTGNRKGPVQYALSQVDVESRLGNRYMALQKNDHAFYIPPLNSDLYEYSMQTGNIISMHQEFQETASKNMDMYNTAPDIFQNATRTNLKKSNI